MLCEHSKNISRLLLSCDRISIKLQLTGKSRLISQLKLTFFAPWYIKEFLTILRQFRYFSRFPKATKDDVMSVSSGLPELCIFFLANYALFFGELCATNPELCANYANCTILHNIFKDKFLMF